MGFALPPSSLKDSDQERTMPESVKQPLEFKSSSPRAIERLIREVEGSGPLAAAAYNRTYNRHNR